MIKSTKHQSQLLETLSCYHCGEDCNHNPILFEEKQFCCSGCKTVYSFLHQTNSCDYYKFEAHPGRKANNLEFGKKYAYLDHDEIKKDLLEFSENGYGKLKFFVPAIHCSACIWLLENLQRLNSGILHSHVNFGKKEVSITFNESLISLREVVELLASINYIPHISLEDLNEEAKKQSQKAILYRLGVAGFCFTNIMLFSFPHYLSVDDTIETFLKQNFGLLNFLLAIPVAFYSGSGYLISAYKGLKQKIISIDLPIAIGILVLFFRSAYEISSGTGPGFMDSLAGLVFFLLIGKWYQGKTYEALSFERDYKSYFPVAVTVLNDNGEEKILPLKHLRPGMRILVRNQELIPADAFLVAGSGYIDYSFVTGESSALPKQEGERIFAGGKQIGSAIELLIEKEVEQSKLTELWNQDSSGNTREDRWESLVDVLGRRFTLVILFISIVAGVFWWFFNKSLTFTVISSILIVACPCALALTVPFSLGGTMRIFGRNGFYLKRTSVVESLAKVDTIVFDKTGTITQNDVFDVDISQLLVNDQELALLKSLVRHSTHPLSVAIYYALKSENISSVTNFSETPAKGLQGIIDGNLVKAGSASFLNIEVDKEQLSGQNVYVSINSRFCGFIKIRNSYRTGMEHVLRTLKSRFDLHLLSGDNETELPVLLEYFPEKDHIHFNQSPMDKLEYIKRLKQKGKRVLMIGDGLNDAGALRESDCGISIADDVFHFSPACDAILESLRFADLLTYLRLSRSGIRIVKISLFFSLLYNIVGLSFAVTGHLTAVVSAILMPLSSVTVVGFITAATIITANLNGLKSKL